MQDRFSCGYSYICVCVRSLHQGFPWCDSVGPRGSASRVTPTIGFTIVRGDSYLASYLASPPLHSLCPVLPLLDYPLGSPRQLSSTAVVSCTAVLSIPKTSTICCPDHTGCWVTILGLQQAHTVNSWDATVACLQWLAMAGL